MLVIILRYFGVKIYNGGERFEKHGGVFQIFRRHYITISQQKCKSSVLLHFV